MIDTNLQRRAEKVWPKNDFVPEPVRQRNMSEWCKAVSYLGDKWLLARHVERKVQ